MSADFLEAEMSQIYQRSQILSLSDLQSKQEETIIK